MRVALFLTCFNELLAPGLGRAVVTVLRRLGCDVDYPEGQTCCGQLHFNTGYRSVCVPLVRRFVDTFSSFDAVVTPSPSCAAMVRFEHRVVAAMAAERGLDSTLPQQVDAVTPRVYELSEFLVDVLGVTDVGASFPHRVVFHQTCHSVRLLRIGDRPQQLLRAVHGLDLVLPNGAEDCCGFGGTFSVKNPEVSVAMGTDKVTAILASGADVLTAADTSCLLHLGGMLARTAPRVRVLHFAEILALGGAQ